MNGIISRLTEGALTQQLSLLYRLARQLPENIWLTKIEVQDKGELFIQGESMDYETIICWIDILKGMEDVHQVKLLSFQGQEVLQFSIALEMGGGLG
jgi:Tfp pilus assembly protein PilN